MSLTFHVLSSHQEPQTTVPTFSGPFPTCPPTPVPPALLVGNLPTLQGPVEIPFPVLYEYGGGGDTVPAAQRLTMQLVRAPGHTGGALAQDQPAHTVPWLGWSHS